MSFVLNPGELASTIQTSKIKAVIFDLDGTLVNTMGDFLLAINGMLQELQFPAIERLALTQLVGKGSEHLVRSVLAYAIERLPLAQQSQARQAMIECAFFNAAFARYQHHYGLINGQNAPVYAGVEAALQTLQKRGLKLACVTNKPLAWAQDLLRKKGLDGFFKPVFGGDSFDRRKPDPLPLLKTCENLGTLAAQSLMVGDSSNDAQAARAAGCPVVLVRYGYNHGQPIEAVKADAYFDTLADLPAWLGVAEPRQSASG